MEWVPTPTRPDPMIAAGGRSETAAALFAWHRSDRLCPYFVDDHAFIEFSPIL